MMGTVWVRLQERQEYIQPYINALVSHSPEILRIPQAYLSFHCSSSAQLS
jgi:hypothetical protein